MGHIDGYLLLKGVLAKTAIATLIRTGDSRPQESGVRVLRVASGVVRQGRRLTFVIAQHAAADWLRLWSKLAALDWASG